MEQSGALILSSLADGAKHGYALTKDIERFAGLRLAPGTLYEALTRLEAQGLIEAVASDDRRRPYRLTAAGARALQAHLRAQRQLAEIGLRRLAQPLWGRAGLDGDQPSRGVLPGHRHGATRPPGLAGPCCSPGPPRAGSS
jgi:DNA-binding PadR family transcriptional regulator